mmetsp:Transcript_2137/g.7633  ORF Transcript_2137/g.7633 Transcript_2137/m.7633 type:complete len:243 (-) Transcript_2137:1938-2666(-)
MARVQRHVAGGRVGAPIGRDIGRAPAGGLPLAAPGGAGDAPAPHAGRARRRHQGVRDRGGAGARELAQSDRGGPSALSQGGDDGGGHAHAGRRAARGGQRGVSGLHRRLRAPLLPPLPQRGVAQGMGLRGRVVPRGVDRAADHAGGDGIQPGAVRAGVGVPGRVLPKGGAQHQARARVVCDGERALPSVVPWGVPRVHSGGGRLPPAPAGGAPARGDHERGYPHHAVVHPLHRQDGAAEECV